MSDETGKKNRLPSWIHEAISQGDITDPLPNKRGMVRIDGSLSCKLRPLDDAGAPSISGRMNNISTSGIGLITRKPIEPGLDVTVVPDGLPDEEAVKARVAHCTQTIQGYKVGCSFEPD